MQPPVERKILADAEAPRNAMKTG